MEVNQEAIDVCGELIRPLAYNKEKLWKIMLFKCLNLGSWIALASILVFVKEFPVFQIILSCNLALLFYSIELGFRPYPNLMTRYLNRFNSLTLLCQTYVFYFFTGVFNFE